MKSRVNCHRILLAPIVAMLFLNSCTKDTNIAGGVTETTSANIYGTIWNPDRSPAIGVFVKLTPTNFDLFAPSAAAPVESTLTNKNGKFFFEVAASGFYNVSAQSGNSCCFTDSVYGSEKTSYAVNDTLKTAGSISGIARLQPGDDNRLIIVLALGTSQYSMVDDSDGVFALPLLAEGEYRLRFLTTNKKYGVFDTTVSVASGKQTVIPGFIRLPFLGVPAIDAINASFDRKTQYVTVSWNACDTANVASIYVFRNTDESEEPLAILGNTAVSFSDDVIMLDPDSLAFGDTLRYSVAALGKDLTLGRIVAAPLVVMGDLMSQVSTIVLPKSRAESLNCLTLKAIHGLYLGGNGWLGKADSSGEMIYSEQADMYARHIAVDGSGNVYVVPGTCEIFKYSPELQMITSMRRIVYDPNLIANMNLLSNDAGHICYTFNNGGARTQFDIYDTAMSIVRSDTLDEFVYNTRLQGDTILFPMNGASTDGRFAVKMYDRELNLISTSDVTPILKTHIPDTCRAYFRRVDKISGERTLLWLLNDWDWQGVGVVIVFDAQGTLLARYGFSGIMTDFDGNDRMCTFDKIRGIITVYRMNLNQVR